MRRVLIALGCFFYLIVALDVCAVEERAYVPGQVILKVNPRIVSTSMGRITFQSDGLKSLNSHFRVRSIGKVFTNIPMIYELTTAFPHRAQRALYGSIDLKSENMPTLEHGTTDWFIKKNTEKVIPDLHDLFVLTVPKSFDIEKVAREYVQDPDVIFAEPNYRTHCLLTPDDHHFKEQWALATMQVPAAWDITTGSSSITIAVLDTGLHIRHPDIANRVWRNPEEKRNNTDDDENGCIDDMHGYNFVANNADVHDRHGHGTFVAGIIGAQALNTLGIAGVDWYAQVMPIKVMSDEGKGDAITLGRGLLYAVRNGADIITISQSTESDKSEFLAEMCDYARSFGCIVLTSVGINNDGMLAAPAGVPSVITVGASDSHDNAAAFSALTKGVDIAAPGVDIISLRARDTCMQGASIIHDQYVNASGTSAAVAYTAGVASLMLATSPSVYVEEVKVLMQENSDILTVTGERARYGRLNAHKAVVAAKTKRTRDFHEYLHLLDTLLYGSWDAQKEAAEAVVLLGDDIVQLLLNILEDPTVQLSVGQKGLLIHTLGQIGSEQAVPYLMDAFADEPNSYLRRNIITALGSIASPLSITVLVDALSDENGGVRARSLQALSAVADETIGETVLSRISDPDEQVRYEAVSTLVEIQDTASVATLLATIKETEVNQAFKDHMVHAVGELGDTSALSQLELYRDDLIQREPEDKMLHFQWEQSVRAVDDAIDKIQNRSQ